MSDELKDQRVVTMMSSPELQAIDDWSFQNRIRSRGEAIRRLCQIGMSAEERMDAAEQSSAGFSKYLSAIIQDLIEHGPRLSDKTPEDWREWAHLALAHIFTAKEEMEKDWLRLKLAEEALGLLKAGSDVQEQIGKHQDLVRQSESIVDEAFDIASRKLKDEGFFRMVDSRSDRDAPA